MTAPAADPLTAPCSWCGAKVGERCGTLSDWARKPHAVRAKLALALAAHADPALDAFFARRGQCALCAEPGLDQRHRVVDAIAGMLEAGEDAADVASEYGLSLDAVYAVSAWAARWPGAWS
jgi:hypothetical protein